MNPTKTPKSPRMTLPLAKEIISRARECADQVRAGSMTLDAFKDRVRDLLATTIVYRDTKEILIDIEEIGPKARAEDMTLEDMRKTAGKLEAELKTTRARRFLEFNVAKIIVEVASL